MQTSQVGILARFTVNIACDKKFKIIEQVLKNEINDIKIKCFEVCSGNS